MANKLKHKIDKDFTIVSNVLLKSKISAKSKGIFLQIISLPEGWDFSIRGLSMLFTDKETSIKSGIDELRSAGFLKWENTKDQNGRFSVIVTTMYPKTPHGEIPHGEIPREENGNNKELKNKECNNKELNNNNSKELAKAEVYGNQEINELFTYWKQTVGYEISGRKQQNRNACSNLIRKHGVDTTKRLINGVAECNNDKYAPRISDFTELQSKMSALLAWGNRKIKQSNSGGVAVI